MSGANPVSSKAPFSFVLVNPKSTESFKRTAIIEALSRIVTPAVSYTVPVIFIDWEKPFRPKNKIKRNGKKIDFIEFCLGVNW